MVFYDHVLKNDITRAFTECRFSLNSRLGISLEEEAHSSTDASLPAPLRCVDFFNALGSKLTVESLFFTLTSFVCEVVLGFSRFRARRRTGRPDITGKLWQTGVNWRTRARETSVLCA